MIRCLAIDDEPLALEQLKNFISKIPYLELVAACPSAMDAKDVLSHEMIDAIFCDINMPDLNGMDFIKVWQALRSLCLQRPIRNMHLKAIRWMPSTIYSSRSDWMSSDVQLRNY